jgi:hypothetical protein
MFGVSCFFTDHYVVRHRRWRFSDFIGFQREFSRFGADSLPRQSYPLMRSAASARQEGLFVRLGYVWAGSGEILNDA